MDFAGLHKIFPSFEKELLAALEEHSLQRTFLVDEPLIRTGQHFKSTLLIVSGLVKVYREDYQGSEFFMYYLQPGEACALSMVCATKSETSQVMAKAVKNTEVLSIPLQYMDQWMSRYKSWYHFVLENYRTRFEELLRTIDHVAFRAMDERLEFYLKEHRDTLKSDTLEISHQRIADELNSSREVISRLLKKMEQLGKLKLHRNSIELISL